MKVKTLTGVSPEDLDNKVNKWVQTMGDSIKVIGTSTTGGINSLVCSITYETKTNLLFD
jgi:hypothetical protein